MIGFILGTIYASFLEWWVHKYLFHERGKKKNSLFAYHLRDHHVVAKRNDFIDIRMSVIETAGLLFLAVIHLPFYYISPMFYGATVIYAVSFFILHIVSTVNPLNCFCKLLIASAAIISFVCAPNNVPINT